MTAIEQHVCTLAFRYDKGLMYNSYILNLAHLAHFHLKKVLSGLGVIMFGFQMKVVFPIDRGSSPR